MLVDHAASLEQTQDLQTLWQGAVDALNSAGVDHVIYLSVDADFGTPFKMATIEGIYADIPPAQDPFLIHSCKGYEILKVGAAFVDHHPYISDQERAFIHQAAKRGFNAGIALPMRLKGAERFGGFILGTDLDGPTFWQKFQSRLDDIRLFCMIIHRRLEELAVPVAPPHNERPALISSALPGVFDALSPRESEVITLLAQGRSRAQTAHLCGISIHTVSDYAKQGYKKLGVTNRAEAAALMLGQPS